MMPDYYVLNTDKSVHPVTLIEWANFFENTDRHVRHTTIKKYNTRISTVFLGLDHGYPQWSGHTNKYRPVLFETMIFCDDPEYDNYMQRYSTWDEALEGHREVVRMIVNVIRTKNG